MSFARCSQNRGSWILSRWLNCFSFVWCGNYGMKATWLLASSVRTVAWDKKTLGCSSKPWGRGNNRSIQEASSGSSGAVGFILSFKYCSVSQSGSGTEWNFPCSASAFLSCSRTDKVFSLIVSATVPFPILETDIAKLPALSLPQCTIVAFLVQFTNWVCTSFP